MLTTLLLLGIAVLLIAAASIGIFLLLKYPKVFAGDSRREERHVPFHHTIFSTIKNKSFSTTGNKIVLFAGSFILALLATPIYIGIIAGSHGKTFSLKTAIYFAGILYETAPLTTLFFPFGLSSYIPGDYEWHLFELALAWAAYLVISISGIRIKQRRLSMLIYFIFIAILVLNVVGCEPALGKALSGID